jgi:hypothetical protein
MLRGLNTMLMVSMIVLGITAQLFARDMELTLDDGRSAILHDDGSWGYTKATISDGSEEDMYIDLPDSRVVWLKNDNTWQFVKSRPQEKRSFAELPTVNIVTSVTRKTLDEAVKAATEDALKRAADKLLPYAKKSKSTHKYIVACIKHELSESGIETSYKPKWIGTAKVSLTRVQSKKILDCAETQLESNADATSGTAPTATGNTSSSADTNAAK